MNLVRKTIVGVAVTVALAGTSALYARNDSAKSDDKNQHGPGMMMQGGGGMMGMMNMTSQMSQMMETCNQMMQGMPTSQHGAGKDAASKQKE